MSRNPNLLVAKFGGTSMAQPEVVLSQLEHEANDANVVVVSAPGKAPGYDRKLTDMLLDHKDGFVKVDEIIDRMEAVLNRPGVESSQASRAVIEGIPADLHNWTANGYPTEALGEYWSAKLFADLSGRQFVDAGELIVFRNNGLLDELATNRAIQSNLKPDGRYVMPGFYGRRLDGRVKTLGRNGSDTTCAIVGRALQVNACYIWSDVNGFMTADPSKVADARLLNRITYREARELGNGGSELLHTEVIKHLGGTGIKTIMKNTFGQPEDPGTTIVDDRAWQWQSIIGVAGRDNLTVLNLHEFGLNEGVGETLDVIRELKAANVPYEHSNDATDDVSIYVDRQYHEVVEAIAEKLHRPGRTLSTATAGLIYVVGEGLAHSGTARLAALGSVATALAAAGIEGRGASDVGSSATLTFFVKPQSVPQALEIAHQALNLGKAPRTS